MVPERANAPREQPEIQAGPAGPAGPPGPPGPPGPAGRDGRDGMQVVGLGGQLGPVNEPPQPADVQINNLGGVVINPPPPLRNPRRSTQPGMHRGAGGAPAFSAPPNLREADESPENLRFQARHVANTIRQFLAQRGQHHAEPASDPESGIDFVQARSRNSARRGTTLAELRAWGGAIGSGLAAAAHTGFNVVRWAAAHHRVVTGPIHLGIGIGLGAIEYAADQAAIADVRRQQARQQEERERIAEQAQQQLAIADGGVGWAGARRALMHHASESSSSSSSEAAPVRRRGGFDRRHGWDAPQPAPHGGVIESSSSSAELIPEPRPKAKAKAKARGRAVGERQFLRARQNFQDAVNDFNAYARQIQRR